MPLATDAPALPEMPPPSQAHALQWPPDWSLADLQEHLGDVPLERIRLLPLPGLATADDALRLSDRGEAICELVDGILVEKPMGNYESHLAMTLGHLILDHQGSQPTGMVAGADGPFKLFPSKMRIPDVSFTQWSQIPGGLRPGQRVGEIPPDLAVEVLSDGNTAGEMNKKLDEYFEAGVKLVWYIDPTTRTAKIYTARDAVEEIDENGMLEGGDVLRGFALRLGDLFDRANSPLQ